MIKWEYTHLRSSDYDISKKISENKLNEFGEEGWEVVSVRFYDSGDICSVVLKRPVKE